MRTKIYTLLLLVTCANLSWAQSAKSVILLYLDGGPAQTETFDPKPTAGRNYAGAKLEESAIKTN
ncbi:MAG: DUF1501 domain-containing protein, partial [Rikenellaceae bacterium]